MNQDFLYQFLNPQLSLSMQIFYRTTYGIIMLGTLIMMLPHCKRFFMSEKWKGYVQDSPSTNFIQNPVVIPVVMTLWLASVACLATGTFVIPASILNLIFCHYFFIQMRWKSLTRGCGAPGFMSYWLAQSVFWLELTLNYAPDLRSLAVLVFQIDFAMIMLSAGTYKFLAGYSRNEGMEYGMVNPMWGYFPEFFTKIRPSNPLYNFLNQNAWFMEVLAALLMFIPQTRLLGGFIIWSSFLFVATQIRLNLLCWAVMLCCFLYSSPGDIVDKLCGMLVPAYAVQSIPTHTGIPLVETIVSVLLTTHLILMLLCHCGLYYNFLGKKRLPGLLQTALEKYTNTFGLIIWRVFTADLCNFYPKINFVPRKEYAGLKDVESIPESSKVLVSNYGWTGGRYRHVCESITVCSIFTTLKYYPSNSPLFSEKIVRYCRTLSCPNDALVEFEYVSIQKIDDDYNHGTKVYYLVDCRDGVVSEYKVDEDFSANTSNKFVPLHESARPGSYAPPPPPVLTSK
jgi:hypothetical protein